jgi:hypothetical protein
VSIDISAANNNRPAGLVNKSARGAYRHAMGALVVVSRTGDRWRADVYSRGAGTRGRLVAEVVGSESCVLRVAREAPALLQQPDGEELLVEFLSANRCRVTRGA